MSRILTNDRGTIHLTFASQEMREMVILNPLLAVPESALVLSSFVHSRTFHVSVHHSNTRTQQVEHLETRL